MTRDLRDVKNVMAMAKRDGIFFAIHLPSFTYLYLWFNDIYVKMVEGGRLNEKS